MKRACDATVTIAMQRRNRLSQTSMHCNNDCRLVLRAGADGWIFSERRDRPGMVVSWGFTSGVVSAAARRS